MIDFYERLDWNLLRTYLIIIQSGGISRAAERMQVTQPAVSLALKRLEDTLEAKLIIRHNHLFEMTEAGNKVYRHAVQITALVQMLAQI